MSGVGAASLRQIWGVEVVALGTKVERGMRRTIGPALRFVGTDGGGQVVGVGEGLLSHGHSD